MDVLFELGIRIGPFLALLAIGYWVGTFYEKTHFEALREREQQTAQFPAMTVKNIPLGWQVQSAQLVTGSVVVSLDYFKRILAGLRAIFGGRIRAYEPLLDRARREALLRMKEEAIQAGFTGVINVRLETSRLAATAGNESRTAGIEILAFGTAIKTSHGV